MHKKTNLKSSGTYTALYQNGGSVMQLLSSFLQNSTSGGSNTDFASALGMEGPNKAKTLNNAVGSLYPGKDSLKTNSLGLSLAGKDNSLGLTPGNDPADSTSDPNADNAVKSTVGGIDFGSLAKHALGGLGSAGKFLKNPSNGLGLGALAGDYAQFNSTANNDSLTGNQKRMNYGDATLNTVSDVASMFGPVGTAVGTGLKLINSIGGSLMGTPQELKDYKTNDAVAKSSGYTGVASQGADVSKDASSYTNAGLVGKLFGGKQNLLDETKAAQATQSQTAGLLKTNSLAKDSANASSDMFSTRNKMKYNNSSMFNNGSVQYGKEGTKVDDIHIKKSHEGKFTEWKKRTGKTTEEALHSDDPHVRKMANFAKNAKSWKHQDGGVIPQYVAPSDNLKAEWNNFQDFLKQKNVAGSTQLDNRNGTLGKDLMNEYIKLNPQTTLRYDSIRNIQQFGNDYRQQLWAQTQSNKPNHPVTTAKTYDEFMPNLSTPDGWLGSRTSQFRFPTATSGQGKPLGFANTTQSTSDMAAKKHQDGGEVLNLALTRGDGFTKTSKVFADGGDVEQVEDTKFNKLKFASLKIPVKQIVSKAAPFIINVPTSPQNSQPINSFKEGGAINVVVDGALHAHKHELKDLPEFEDAEITHKGIPVITKDEDGNIVQQAEVEKGEIVLHLKLTKKLEELMKDGSDESAILAGKLLSEELMTNTEDKTGKFEEIE